LLRRHQPPGAENRAETLNIINLAAPYLGLIFTGFACGKR